jgi:hypothetical protein
LPWLAWWHSAAATSSCRPDDSTLPTQQWLVVLALVASRTAPVSLEMEWKDLASFKERHQDQLHGFRRYVERELRALALVG